MTNTGLTLKNLQFAYNTLKNNRDNMSAFDIGKHLGFLEAGLYAYGTLETVNNEDTKSKFYGDSQIKREVIKSKKWWKKDKLESMEESIVRQIEKLFITNNS